MNFLKFEIAEFKYSPESARNMKEGYQKSKLATKFRAFKFRFQAKLEDCIQNICIKLNYLTHNFEDQLCYILFTSFSWIITMLRTLMEGLQGFDQKMKTILGTFCTQEWTLKQCKFLCFSSCQYKFNFYVHCFSTNNFLLTSSKFQLEFIKLTRVKVHFL